MHISELENPKKMVEMQPEINVLLKKTKVLSDQTYLLNRKSQSYKGISY